MIRAPAVVFDLDGTLADTAGDVQRALNRTLASEGLAPLDVPTVRLMIGGGPRLLVLRALAELRSKQNRYVVDKLTELFHDEYLRQETTDSRLFAGAADCLRRLHGSGTRIGVCSNKPEDICHKVVSDLGVADYIDVIVGSGSGLPRKPDPAPLLAVIEQLGSTPAAALYVGDSETDVKTARAAGVDVVLVDYGYSARPASELGADRVYASLADIAISEAV